MASLTRIKKASESITQLTERLKVILDNATKDASQKAPDMLTEAVINPLEDMAKRAKEVAEKAIHWITGVFGALAILIFGSLPFTKVGEVPGGAPTFWLSLGLGMAALGITGAVVAASTVSEPCEATLTSLEQALNRRKGTGGNGEVITKKLHWWNPADWNPRRKAEARLSRVFTGPERMAHLGPGMNSIRELNDELARLESRRLHHSAHTAEKRSLTEQAAKNVQLLREEEKLLHARFAEFEQKGDGWASEERGRVTRRIAELAVECDRVSRAWISGSLEFMDHKSKLNEVEARLDVFTFHRHLVLTESAVMQIKGNFRFARFCIAIGSLLTLAGGSLYAANLPA